MSDESKSELIQSIKSDLNHSNQSMRFYRAIIQLLRENGNEGKPKDIVDKVIEFMNVSQEELDLTNQNGESKIRNQVHWARQTLVYNGYIDSEIKGYWKLTEKGKNQDLMIIDLEQEHKEAMAKSKTKKDPKTNPELQKRITDEAFTELLERVNAIYPDWTGFSDERFIKDETKYKRENAKKA